MKRSLILLHICIFLAGLTGIFGKLIALNEILITFYRMLLSAVILLFIPGNLFTARKALYFPDLFKMCGVGFVLGLHWIFFYASIKYSNISVGVVCFCLSSFFTAIFEPIINKKKISISEILLSCLTLVGICLIFSFDIKYRFGIVLGVISAMLVAIYTIINEKLVHRYESKMLTTVEMTGGAICIGILLPFLLKIYPESSFCPSLSDLLYLIILSGLCTVLLYMILNRALKDINAFTLNLSFNLEPIYSILIAIFFFNEFKDLNLSFIGGLLLILSSLGLQMLRIRKNVQ